MSWFNTKPRVFVGAVLFSGFFMFLVLVSTKMSVKLALLLSLAIGLVPGFRSVYCFDRPCGGSMEDDADGTDDNGDPAT